MQSNIEQQNKQISQQPVKRSPGRQALRIVLPLLIQGLVTNLIAFVLQVMISTVYLLRDKSIDPMDPMIMEKAMEISMKAAEEVAKYSGYLTIMVAVIMIPIMLALFLKDRKDEKKMGIAAVPKEQLWKYGFLIPFGIVLCIAMNNIVTLANAAFYSSSYRNSSAALYSVSFVLQLLGFGLIVPVSEELIYRGLIYRRIKERASAKTAAVISAFVFGYLHGNLVQGIYGFIMGLLFIYIYEKFGSLKAPILMHMVLNITSVIATKIKLFDLIFKTPLTMGIVTVICAAGASATYIVLQKITGNRSEGDAKL